MRKKSPYTVLVAPAAAALLAFLAGACASATNDVTTNASSGADAGPIGVRTPPESKDGSATAAGCDGVTARGECQEGAAVYCDLERGEVRRVDCKALGSDCLVDTGRGAICTSIDHQATSEQTPCTDTGVSEAGFCQGNVARYCDTSGDEPVTRMWDCSTADKSCESDSCTDGAYCCGGEESSAAAADECGGLDFDGVCDGETARWCSGGTIQELDCAARGQNCESDTCATGAYCCGSTEESSPEVSECVQLGFAGECVGNTVRFCSGEQILEVTCPEGRMCQEDVCGGGALCCEDPCANLGADGTCDGDLLRYCVGGVLNEVDCSAQGTSCEEDTCLPGMAECC